MPNFWTPLLLPQNPNRWFLEIFLVGQRRNVNFNVYTVNVIQHFPADNNFRRINPMPPSISTTHHGKFILISLTSSRTNPHRIKIIYSFIGFFFFTFIHWSLITSNKWMYKKYKLELVCLFICLSNVIRNNSWTHFKTGPC